jgi:protein-tyrosine phosphatase
LSVTFFSTTAMTLVAPGLYQSGWPLLPGEVVAAGIRTAFDLTGAGSAATLEPAGIRVVNRAIPDGAAPPMEWLEETVELVREAMRVGPVLVHCAQGISRSSLVTVATVMAELGVGRDEALAVVRQSRPWAYPCPAMMDLLLGFRGGR